jgi:hypothetical protein
VFCANVAARDLLPRSVRSRRTGEGEVSWRGAEQTFGDLSIRFVDQSRARRRPRAMSRGEGDDARRAMPHRAGRTGLRFDADGQVDFRRSTCRAGGRVAVAGINATAGSVRFLLDGLGLA